MLGALPRRRFGEDFSVVSALQHANSVCILGNKVNSRLGLVVVVALIARVGVALCATDTVGSPSSL